MKNLSFINTKQTTLILVLISLLASFSFAGMSKKKSNRKIDRYIKNTMKQHQIPGVALAVIKNGKVVHKNYYGKANLEHNVPVSDKTVFRIFSTTKLMVATGIFQLIEKEKIALEDEVSKYVDGLPTHWQSVKIKHLLSFSSGLPQIQLASTEEEMAQKTYIQKTQFQPGEYWNYIQSNVWLLKKVIEKTSGLSFDEYLLKNQFPESTNVYLSSSSYDIIPNRVSIYKAENPRQKVEITTDYGEKYLHFANGFNMTLDELIKWNRNLDKGVYLNNKTKSLMWSDYKYTKSNREFAHGWGIYRVNGKKSYGFTGGGSAGLRKFLDKDLTIVFMSNGYKFTPIPDEIINHVAGIVDKDLIDKDSLFNEYLISNFFSNDLNNALVNYEKARKQNPTANIEQKMNSIGYGLARFGRNKDAIEVFKINAIEYPKSGNVWDSLGEGYEMSGDFKNAIINYKKSLEIDKTNQHAKDKIKLLSEKVK